MSIVDAAQLRCTHASGLHNVTAALSGLHRDRLRADGDEVAPVHACVVNVVAACTDRAMAERAADDLIAIGVRHPARAIVVLADPDAEPRIEADVSLQCAAGSDTRVCTEMLRLEVDGDPAYHLTSIVTPLLVPDVPVQLWIVGNPPLRQPFTPEVVELCERIILDTGAYDDARETLSTIAGHLQHLGDRLWLSDIAWERTHLWRLLLAQAFDGHDARSWLRSARDIEVRHGDHLRTDALLFAGWLADRLETEAVRVVASEGHTGLHGVHVHCENDGGTADVDIVSTGTLLTTTCRIGAHMTMSRAVAVPPGDGITDEAQLISRLMAETSDDPMYRAAVARGARLAPQPAA